MKDEITSLKRLADSSGLDRSRWMGTWWAPRIGYSTGSSMVSTLLVGVLGLSSMKLLRVVLLPEPVTPAMAIIPLGVSIACCQSSTCEGA